MVNQEFPNISIATISAYIKAMFKRIPHYTKPLVNRAESVFWELSFSIRDVFKLGYQKRTGLSKGSRIRRRSTDMKKIFFPQLPVAN